MRQVNIHEAKTHLSRLVEQAARGEPFVIARAGRPMVTVTAYQPPLEPASRVGFMPSVQVPEDFDTMGRERIVEMFEGVE